MSMLSNDSQAPLFLRPYGKMASFLIEIHPKKAAFDPLAKQVRSELLATGASKSSAVVFTRRLYRIEGDLSAEQVETIAQTLLVDPVVETSHIENGKASLGPRKRSNKRKQGGWMLDIWPKPGVTDPVGETVEKGLLDLGYHSLRARSGRRYIFPNINDRNTAQIVGHQFLANELIHVIDIRKIN